MNEPPSYFCKIWFMDRDATGNGVGGYAFHKSRLALGQIHQDRNYDEGVL